MDSITDSPPERTCPQRRIFGRASKIQDSTRKWCPGCGAFVLRTEFYKRKLSRDGLTHRCRLCIKAIQSTPEHKDAARASTMKRVYGITVEDFDAMLACQGGRCAICERIFDKILTTHIDHDHATGKVRGILCKKCNLFLHALEEQDWYEKATAYLERHGK